jgi:hypothetical protein
MICFVFIWHSSEVSSFRVCLRRTEAYEQPAHEAQVPRWGEPLPILCAERVISHCTTDKDKATVKPLLSPAFALVIAIVGAADGLAQDRTPAGGYSTAVPNTIDPLTGKERLGRKWMDEQRIDNCKVPPDKRGGRPRSSECPHAPTG